MNFSFLPFGLHDFVCWVFFWDAWFVVYDDVAFCRFVREGSFSSFGLHEFVVAFCCRIVRLVCGMIIMLHFADMWREVFLPLWVAWFVVAFFCQVCELGFSSFGLLQDLLHFAFVWTFFCPFFGCMGFLLCFADLWAFFFLGVLGSHMIDVAVCRFLRFVLSLCSVWFGCCIL